MSNTFRATYRQLTVDEAELVEQIKDAATRLEQQFTATPGRMSAIAREKLEEAVMWAVKGITG